MTTIYFMMGLGLVLAVVFAVVTSQRRLPHHPPDEVELLFRQAVQAMRTKAGAAWRNPFDPQ